VSSRSHAAHAVWRLIHSSSNECRIHSQLAAAL
jgi:hypothetical protein